MRDPSLHITKSQLIKILNKVLDVEDSKGIVDKIMKKARKLTPVHRGITVSSDRLEKKVKKATVSTIADAELFSLILLHKRRSLKHRGLRQIKTGSRDWNLVKDITSLANEFCEAYNLEKKQGYIHFINIGIERMNKFMLVKFLNMASSIIDIYGYMNELDKDDHPNKTKELYTFYQNQILSKTGLRVNYERPEKYVYFYRARQQAEQIGISGIEYIKAQFYALEWRSGYPDPAQLVNDKAIQNLNKYLYEKGINLKQKKSKIDWKAIKKLGNDND